jgi:ATP-dependent DNA helicase RecG
MPLDRLKGAGPAAIKHLAKVGVFTVADLLCRYPRDWEDRSHALPLKDFARGPVCSTVRVLASDWFGFGRMRTLKVFIEDDTARASLVCFNRPFLEKQLHVGKQYHIWGHFFYKYGEIQSSAFEFEPLEGESRNFGAILPLYPLSADLTQNLLRRLIRAGLEQYAPALESELPALLIKENGLMEKAQAIQAVHFPKTIEERDAALKSIKYEELFYLEVEVGKRALERKKLLGTKQPLREAGVVRSLSPLQKRLVERLPFKLTAGQEAAVADINADMSGAYAMARLLQGDVGSGKTLVSFMAVLAAVDSGGQAALMAPTELLARQHAENAAGLLEPLGLSIAFLSANIKAAGRKELLKTLAGGKIDLVVGTHALFSSDVAYHQLRLVIIDEQHRFGVTQRQAILNKGNREGLAPDLLMMSATPIPRSLALTVFGDLDVSIIRDMPPGRKAVVTHLNKMSNEAKVYGFVARELARGRQAYFVYPLIEAADPGGSSLKDAEGMAKRLADAVFPQYTVALIHSRLEENEKRQTMEAFRKGAVHILVATSVVEVGVDVPNATCMVIEHAERFGLSALHQLRGRVGRGGDQSYCFLVYSDNGLSDDGKQRLKVMLENSDGFVIAEEDLKLRGPGQIAGIEQSGYLTLGLADPVRDADMLARARVDAFKILETDPGLEKPEHRCIQDCLTRIPYFSII